jgi:hypothetical protein
MLKKMVLLTAATMVLGVWAGCGDDDGGGSGGNPVAKLRSCGLITEGDVNMAAPESDAVACYYDCYMNASCGDLEQLICENQPSQSLGMCMQNCDTQYSFDCADGSDTIPETWVCDGMDDCADGSDEVNCPTFQCADGSDTIPAEWQCDCEADCSDGSDEAGCGSGYCFECADGSWTVPQSYVCDMYDDCNDGSDEAQGCATMICPE